MVFGFLSRTEWGHIKKIVVTPKLKVGGGGLLAHMYVYNVFFDKY
jgi:hypothetical protein